MKLGSPIETHRGVYEVHKTSRGWGVLNLTTGRVDRCRTKAECVELLRDRGMLLDEEIDFGDEFE